MQTHRLIIALYWVDQLLCVILTTPVGVVGKSQMNEKLSSTGLIHQNSQSSSGLP